MSTASAYAHSPTRPAPGAILIVEDELWVREMLAEELRAEGHKVVEAVKGEEAIAMLRSKPGIELVVTDMCMSGAIDAATLVNLIRAEFPNLKVVMMSGQRPDVKVLS